MADDFEPGQDFGGATGFKDIRELAGSTEQLQNVVLSHNPCPSCQDANGKAMTYDEWEQSEWGLPGSAGRICEDDCHCILAPVGVLPNLSGIDERAVKLRGDEGTDVGGTVDIGPHEDSLKADMEDWYLVTGGEKLPPEIYTMPFDEIGPYMKKKLAEAKARIV